MAIELRARGVSREELAYQMGHELTDLRTTDRYTKFDKRYLATPWLPSSYMFAT